MDTVPVAKIVNMLEHIFEAPVPLVIHRHGRRETPTYISEREARVLEDVLPLGFDSLRAYQGTVREVYPSLCQYWSVRLLKAS